MITEFMLGWDMAPGFPGGMHNVRLEFFLLMTVTSSEAPS